MTKADTGPLALTNDESFIHMIQCHRLGRLVGDVLTEWPKETGRVRAMEPYEQIEFLKEIAQRKDDGIQPVTLTSIHYFLEEVQPHEEKFRIGLFAPESLS
jgi:hypothetical protein